MMPRLLRRPALLRRRAAAAAAVRPLSSAPPAGVDTPDPTPAPVKAALRALYLSGAPPSGGPLDARLGQPRVVAATTGGGGHLLAFFLSEPGASSCLLEAVVPYDKHSCLGFLARGGRSLLVIYANGGGRRVLLATAGGLEGGARIRPGCPDVGVDRDPHGRARCGGRDPGGRARRGGGDPTGGWTPPARCATWPGGVWWCGLAGGGARWQAAVWNAVASVRVQVRGSGCCCSTARARVPGAFLGRRSHQPCFSCDAGVGCPSSCQGAPKGQQWPPGPCLNVLDGLWMIGCSNNELNRVFSLCSHIFSLIVHFFCRVGGWPSSGGGGLRRCRRSRRHRSPRRRRRRRRRVSTSARGAEVAPGGGRRRRRRCWRHQRQRCEVEGGGW
jgi:hypothetical protein